MLLRNTTAVEVWYLGIYVDVELFFVRNYIPEISVLQVSAEDLEKNSLKRCLMPRKR